MTNHVKIPPTERHVPSRRIQAYMDRAREKILKELKPTAVQVERGLALHGNAIVCDTMGGVSHGHVMGFYSRAMEEWLRGELLKAEDPPGKRTQLDSARRRVAAWRAFEAANDPEMQQDEHAFWDAAGVTLGIVCLDNTAATLGSFAKMAAFETYLQENVDHLEKVNRLDRLDELKAQGRHGVLRHWHDSPGQRVDDLNALYGLGVRFCALTHGHDNRWGCSDLTNNDTGLTSAGRDLVRRMNALGIIVDPSHCGPKTMLDVIEAADDPVIVSHTACRSVARGEKSEFRNIRDDAMKRIADKGGVVGITSWPRITGGYNVAAFLRHLDYAKNLIGADHLCIGTDRGIGLGGEPEEFIALSAPTSKPEEDVLHMSSMTPAVWRELSEPTSLSWSNWPYVVTIAMVCQGYSDDDITRIIGANFVRVARPILDRRPRGALFEE